MAGGFGGQFVHPDQLLKSMTSLQLAEWMAFASLEPFGERNRDFSVGVLSSLFANVHRNTKAHPEPFTAHDFMPGSVESQYIKPVAKKSKTRSFSLLDMFRMLRDNQMKKKKVKG